MWNGNEVASVDEACCLSHRELNLTLDEIQKVVGVRVRMGLDALY
jgi:hypothetical protein